jgi:hypothetical protein
MSPRIAVPIAFGVSLLCSSAALAQTSGTSASTTSGVGIYSSTGSSIVGGYSSTGSSTVGAYSSSGSGSSANADPGNGNGPSTGGTSDPSSNSSCPFGDMSLTELLAGC